MVTATVLLAIALLMGFVLMFLGLRGRRVDDHLLCRKCGFDLSGTPDAAACNECGRDLTKKRAIRLGHHRRRVLPLTLGAVLLIPSLLVLGLVIYGTASGVDWQEHKPQWWLRMDLASSNVTVSDAAIDEMVRRYLADAEALTGESRETLVESLLDAQADTARPWDYMARGQAISNLRRDGEVSDETWGRFLLQSVRLELAVRPIARIGDPIPVLISSNYRRTSGTVTFHGMVTLESIEVDGKPAGVPEWAKENFIDVSPNYPGWPQMGFDVAEPLDDLRPGAHDVRVRGTIAVIDGPAPAIAILSADRMATALFDLVARTTVEPESADVAITVVDESLRQAVESGISISPFYWEDPWRDGRSPPVLTTLISFDGVPVSTLFKIGVIPSNAEPNTDPLMSEDGAIPTRAGVGILGIQTSIRVPEWPNAIRTATSIDLYLIPDVEGSKSLDDGDPIWGDVIIIRNVPVLESGYSGARAGARFSSSSKFASEAEWLDSRRSSGP